MGKLYLYLCVQIYGGVDLSAPQLVRLCHTQTEPQVYLSTGNNVVVQFVSDISNSGRGFRATYHTVDGGMYPWAFAHRGKGGQLHRFESIRFVKKRPFDSLVVMQFFSLFFWLRLYNK